MTASPTYYIKRGRRYVPVQEKLLTEEQAWGRSSLMAMAAFRYCCGRMTYVVSECADWLCAVWPLLPENTRAIIQRDLENEFVKDDEARATSADYKPLGHNCDRQSWEQVRRLWQPDLITHQKDAP